MTQPLFWMRRKDDDLTSAIKSYLCNEPLAENQITILRDYLKDWFDAMPWRHPELGARISELIDRASIDHWLDDALVYGIDPL